MSHTEPKGRMNRRKFLRFGAAAAGVAAAGTGYFLYAGTPSPTRTTLQTSPATALTTTTDVTPPLVRDLKWEATRAVSDKVYDGRVGFTAEDQDSVITDAYLDFEPIYPPHLPKEAFPEERSRHHSFTGTNGIQSFSQDITDLKGGKEYKVRVGARDRAGNEGRSALDISYLREFENTGPTKIDAITAYYVFYHVRTEDAPNWKDGHKYTPILGEYLSHDEAVIRRHVDWISGHGIKHLLVSWGAPEEWLSKKDGQVKKHHQVLDENLQTLIDNPLLGRSGVKLGILYETGRLLATNPNVPWERKMTPENIEILRSDFAYLAERHFSHPNFWRLAGKPVVYIYDTPAMTGDLRAAVQAIREAVRRAGSDEVFLIADFAKPHREVFPSRNGEWAAMASLFDAITSWLGGYMPDGKYLGGSYEKQIDAMYAEWFRWCRAKGIPLIPYVTPEFDARLVSWGDPAEVPVPRSPDLFAERVKIAVKYSGLAGMIAVGSWNEFFESTALEPSKEFGFTYLETLFDSIKGS